MSNKGFFKPKNPGRYKGDPTNIIYRSSWEFKLMTYLDVHPDIIEWSSEEFAIPYRSPIDGKIHRYFPDFKIKQRNRQGTIETVVVEVKPKKQLSPPMPMVTQKTNKPTRRYIQEVATYGINQAKWKAAQSFCEDRKWRFLIMTEDNLGIK